MTYNVLDIANKLLQMEARDGEEYMTNMKLQKMLYYQQGFHLAYFGTPLFEDEIEAWMYGPVVKSVYYHFKSFGRNGIEPDMRNILTFKDSKEEALFNEVFKVYGIYSASALMNKTHSERPWLSTPTGEGNIIPKEVISEFFKSRLKK